MAIIMSGYNNPIEYPQKLADVANTPREETRNFNPQMMIPPPSYFGSGQYPNQQMYYPPQFDTYGPGNVVFVPQNNTYFSHVEYRQGAGAGGQTQVVRQNLNVTTKFGDAVMHHSLRDILRDVQRALPGVHTKGFVEQLQQVMVRPPLSRASVRPEAAGGASNRRSKRRLKYTREQDDLIVRLKKEGKLWVEIAEVSGVGSYLAARNRYQVIVGQQGNNNSSSWTPEDRRVLHEVLDNAELDKWRCIAAELSKASGKTFTSKECRDMVRYLFWTNPSSFSVSDEVVTECAKEQKITERAVLQEQQLLDEQHQLDLALGYGKQRVPSQYLAFLHQSPSQVFQRYANQPTTQPNLNQPNHQNHQNQSNLSQPNQPNLNQPNQPNLNQPGPPNLNQPNQPNLNPNHPNLNQPSLNQLNQLNQPKLHVHLSGLHHHNHHPHPQHPQPQPPYDHCPPQPYHDRQDDYKLYY